MLLLAGRVAQPGEADDNSAAHELVGEGEDDGEADAGREGDGESGVLPVRVCGDAWRHRGRGGEEW